MKTIFSLLFVINCFVCFASAEDIFQGDDRFEKEEKKMNFTAKKAREILLDKLKQEGLKPVAHPEEVIMLHKGGYLFPQGDFKFRIPMKGYFVDAKGRVKEIDLKRSMTVKDYMKKLGRNGWGNRLRPEN